MNGTTISKMSHQERNFWTDPLTWGCNAGLFVFGMAMAILGAILPILFERVELDPSQAGSLFLLLNLGALIVTIGGGPAFDRFGFKILLAICSVFAAIALFRLSQADSYESLAASSFILGLGGGGLNVGINALVSDLYPGRQSVALNRIGIFFGLGTCLMPLFVGALLRSLGLEMVLSTAAVIAGLPALLFLALPFPKSKQAGGISLGQMVSILRNPYLLLLGLILFFQSGNEITTSGWITTFLVTNVGTTPSQASLYLAGFWGSFILGRLGTSWLLKFVQPSRLVQFSAAFSALVILAFALLSGPYKSLVLVCVLGFSIAPVFATVMGEATSRFPSHSGTVLGALLGMALVGGILAPWITGVLVEEVGITRAFAIPFLGFLGVLLMQTLARRRGQK
jgi:FHS family glucose/mannose:H+ symporter-like MFS transporter